MPPDVEGRIVDPNRPAATWWRADQPLPQPGHRGDALGQDPLGNGGFDPPVELQHCSEMFGAVAVVHREERQISVTRSVDAHGVSVYAAYPRTAEA